MRNSLRDAKHLTAIVQQSPTIQSQSFLTTSNKLASLQPQATSLLSVSWICFFWIFHTNAVTQYVGFLCLASFYLAERFQGSPVLQHVSVLCSFMTELMFDCIDIPHFVCPFMGWWTWRLSSLLDHCEQCRQEHWCTSFCLNACLQFFGLYTLTMESLDHMVIEFFFKKRFDAKTS